MAHYRLFFDGSCGPKNPGGTAGYGYALLKDGEEAPVRVGSGIIGSGPLMSNNLAEFHALDQGLCAFISCYDTAQFHHLDVFGDSRLVIQIMNRHWKPRPDKLYTEAYEYALSNLKIIRRAGHKVTFDWIPRELNTYCDTLSKAHERKDKKRASS